MRILEFVSLVLGQSIPNHWNTEVSDKIAMVTFVIGAAGVITGLVLRRLDRKRAKLEATQHFEQP